MSIDKSLRRKSGMSKVRNVMTRVERMSKLVEEGKMAPEDNPYGMPKVKVVKVVLKKVKKTKEEKEEKKGKKKK